MAKPKKPKAEESPVDETLDGPPEAPVLTLPEPGPAKILSSKDRIAGVLASAGMKSLAKDGTTVVTADRVGAVPRVRTGLVRYDLMMRGGKPVGVVEHWFGPKASGKTSLLLYIIGVMQKTCSHCHKPFSDGSKAAPCCGEPRVTLCALLNMEGVLDMDWARRLGVDTDSLLYNFFRSGEQCADTYDALLSTGEVDFIGIDSLAALVPESELGKAAGEVDVGSQARLVHRIVRKTVSHLNDLGARTRRRPTVVLTNQIRMKVGVVFGNPETTAAGNGPGYVAAVELRFGAPEYAKDKDGNPLAVTYKPKVEKSKLFPGKGEEAEVTLAQRPTEYAGLGDVLDAPALITLGVQAGLVEGTAPNITCLGRSFRGKSVLEVELQKDRGYAHQLREAILGVMLQA